MPCRKTSCNQTGTSCPQEFWPSTPRRGNWSAVIGGRGRVPKWDTPTSWRKVWNPERKSIPNILGEKFILSRQENNLFVVHPSSRTRLIERTIGRVPPTFPRRETRFAQVRRCRIQPSPSLAQVHRQPCQYVLQGVVDVSILLMRCPEVVDIIQRSNPTARAARVSLRKGLQYVGIRFNKIGDLGSSSALLELANYWCE